MLNPTSNDVACPATVLLIMWPIIAAGIVAFRSSSVAPNTVSNISVHSPLSKKVPNNSWVNGTYDMYIR